MSQQQSEWITTEEAAAIMGIERASVQHLCKTEAIVCQRFGGKIWQVSRESAERYVKTAGGRGKKIGKKDD